jgi:hypothetical protein
MNLGQLTSANIIDAGEVTVFYSGVFQRLPTIWHGLCRCIIRTGAFIVHVVHATRHVFVATSLNSTLFVATCGVGLIGK